MSSQISRLSIFAALLAASVTVSSAKLDEGAALPSLSGFQLDGTLPSLRGKIVWLDFCASWCGPCRASFPVMDRIYNKYKARGLVVLGVSVDDDAQKWQSFVEKTGVTFPVVRDAQHKLVSSAGIENMPTSFLIDATGHIVAVYHGFKGAETEAAVEQEIESLLKGKKP